ncbi:MAG: hypothetical protein J2P46_00025 [Zavarzinella sp.]|nr:hypothetical protein [Zavarzinella sp.]
MTDDPQPGRLRATFLLLVCCTAAAGQEPDQRLGLKNLGPSGARSFLTDSWGVLGFKLTNSSGDDVEARVLTFYSADPGRQYGRDVWVPAKATLGSWSCIGPPPGPTAGSTVELKSLLYDRTGGQEHLVRSPDGPPVHSDLVRYARREPTTALLIDADIADGSQPPPSPEESARANDVRNLVRLFRHQAQLSERVNAIPQRFLPPMAEGLDGIDHLVLASDRIRDDPAGRRTLREWLVRGGTLWVMLDLVQQETVAKLLGDALDLEVVDRVSLTHIQFRNGPGNAHRAEVPPTDLEDPVDFVRVLAPGQQVLYTVDGCPAAFLKEVGRGRVLFTTLGARGWMRERTARDPKPRYREFPGLPVALVPFDFLVSEIHPGPEREAISPDRLHGSVAREISYSVADRGTVLWVFGALLVALAGAAVALARKGWLEHLGWLGPGLAIVAAGAFVAIGQRSRSAVPPTVAVTQIVEAVPGLDEVQAEGYLAGYQPSVAAATVGADRGGTFDLDMTGLEGRAHRRVQQDQDRWHWENLELPTGVRAGPFRKSIRTAAPVEAVGRFGPTGLEGRVNSGPFGDLEDALISAPGRHTVAVRVGPGGSFHAGPDDELHGGQLIVGGLLSDRQRARQGVYEELLAEPQPRHVANRTLLLAWARPADLHFTLTADARMTGEALLVIPVELDRTPPATPVTVPAAFVECRRVTSDGRQLAVATDSPLATTMGLRFRIPAPVLPLNVEGARLTLRLSAPGREVNLGALAGGQVVPVRRLTSPIGAEQIEIDPSLARPDGDGDILLNLRIGEAEGGSPGRNPWRLESAGLDVRGRTAAEDRP